MLHSKIKSDIAQHGLHIIHVMSVGDLPNFSYSIGLYETYNQPEIIIVGLKQDINHIIINNIAYAYKEACFFENGEYYENMLDNFKCLVLDVNQKYYDEYVGQALEYYGDNKFPIQQIVWPATNGKFPFDEGAPDSFKQWEPVLGNYQVK